jgi:DNA-directed RNA polymerase subunit RPC12/RpoP
MQSPKPRAVYLACPHCGTRYLARAQPTAGAAPKKDRWFRCQRCDKRVRSIDPVEPDPLTVDDSAE